MKVICAILALAAFAALYQQLRPRATRRPAPDFTLPTLPNEHTIALRQYRGRTVVVNFFATWCHNCRAEKKFLLALHAELPVIAILTFDPNPDLTTLPELPVAFDANGTVARRYGVNWLPQTFLLDGRGRIVQHFNQPLNATRYARLRERSAALKRRSHGDARAHNRP